MPEETNSKRYDLEERTYQYAKYVRAFVKRLPRTVCNLEDVRQLAKSSGSIGANYIEANGALGKKDFKMRIRISRKESKETVYWLCLVDTGNEPASEEERAKLIQEGTELVKIFGAILKKCE